MDRELLDRIEALEIQIAAHDALFNALAMKLGSEFLDVAEELTQFTGAHPDSHPAVQKRMTEVLRILEQFHGPRGGKPKPKGVI